MEAARAVSSSRKEWRAVASDHPVQNSGEEDLDRTKLGLGDERLIYEVNQCSEPITVCGGFDHELHIDDVVKQREQLQHLEVHLKAQIMARSEVMGMQERFDSQIKEHVASNVKLAEQLHEREKAIMDLQRTVDDKDKELHVIKLEHEAAWAKEDLLREQNKELATFRRERDNSEAERAQHLKKFHELQEHVQEKGRQFLELQEQHRVAQETIMYKDEQIREAQAWIARAQEMDALQSTTNHSLQAELRERTEQYNQLWIGCQRQFSEMERRHLHTLQKLEIELSEARERSGNQTSVKEISHFVHGNGSQLEASVGSNPDVDSRSLQNGDPEIVSSQTDGTPGVQMAAKSLHGMPTYFPSGQMHPFIFHHPQNVNSHFVQSHVGQFHSLAASSSIPHWQIQQALSESLQMPNHEQHPSQNDQNLSRPETNYDYEASVKAQTLGSDFLNVVPSSADETERLSLQQISSQLHGFLRLSHSDNDSAHKEMNSKCVSNHKAEAQSSSTEQLCSTVIASQDLQAVKISEVTPNKVDSIIGNNFSVGKTAENLFDEETLLACVVRTIPPASGGRIQISSTLMSRLTKMLAPLRWSDYENKHGKLDAFLRGHPELFVIEGDYIQVQEGAQEIIAGMVARAKVRAATVAASAAANHPSLLSSVAVTPMAQTRLKQGPSVNSYFSESHHSNGVLFNPVGARVLSKHNDQMKQIFVNGNGANLDRPNLGSQGKVINSGRPGPNYHGKQQGRSTGGLLSSRK